MGQHDVRLDLGPQVLEPGLDLVALIGKEAVVELRRARPWRRRRRRRNAAADASASAARAPVALSTHQWTSSRTPDAIQPRSVPPAPISMSSECAPRHRTDSVSSGRASCKALIAPAIDNVLPCLAAFADAPRHLALLDHLLEDLPVLQIVHAAPEALVLVGHELVRLDQPRERLEHQLLALVHVVEDLGPQDEVAGVDPDVRAVGRAELAHPAVRLDVGQVIGQRRPDREEAGELAAPPEALDHVVQVRRR